MQKLIALSATAMATSVAACSKDRGYAVVDPMPIPPTRCFDPNGILKTTITANAAGGFTLRVELLPEAKAISFEHANGSAQAYKAGGAQLGATCKLVDRSARHITLDLEVPDGATTYVTISGVDCQDPNARGFAVTLSPGDAGTLPIVTVGEGYGY